MQSFNRYGQISDMEQAKMDRKKKRSMAIMGVSAAILLMIIVVVTVSIDHRGSASDEETGGSELQTSMKAIKEFCQPTDYKETCIKSLSAAGSNSTNPKDLIKLSFELSMNQMRKAFKESRLLKAVERDPRTSKALSTCQELVNYAVADLRESVYKLGDLDLSEILEFVEDLRIWLSAGITYQETCLDAFENTTGDAGEQMKKALKSSMELTSNTLAIVTEISNVLTNFKLPFFNRRLLSTKYDNFPLWVSAGSRRLLAKPAEKIAPDVVVAKDGSGNFTSINRAIRSIPKRRKNETFVIYIKQGIYRETVQVNRSMTNVMMIGDGPNKTKITGHKNFIDGTPTFKTATVAVVGDGFMAKDIGFENTAGPEKHQAVALRVQSDRSIFYNCRMDGYQDTLYAHTHRQFYRDCTITGTIDFIFGNSAVVFQNCKLIVRKPLENQKNIIAAHGRKFRQEPTGFIIQNCSIKADPVYYPIRLKQPTYLARPWKLYSRTFYMQSFLDDLIHPDGWLPWFEDFGLNTCFYSEYKNRGPGSNTTRRVKWRGVKNTTEERAKLFTASTFIGGNLWIKPTGVPYTPGLLPVS